MTFAEKVYDAVKRIPRGRVATYGQIAEIIGCPGGARAVGNALHVNPFAPVVPCHRVVAADGRLAANFGCGGPAVQHARLLAEGVSFADAARCAVDLSKCGIRIECHPLEPFLPSNGRILFLGSFPPPKARWSMDFFYPNWINDFWRIQSLIHFDDPHYFEIAGKKCFDKDRIISFCESKGLAFYDTASKICRWKGNASDDFLEILEPANVGNMLMQMPECFTVVTTGGKAAEEFAAIIEAADAAAGSPKGAAAGTQGEAAASAARRLAPAPPAVGTFVDVVLAGRTLRWWRMPSSSRAYPMSLKDKASHYAQLF